MAQQPETAALSSIGDSLVVLLSEFWWVPVLVGLAWYLRWYGKADEADVDNPGVRGLMLLLSDMERSSKSAVGAIVVLFVAVAGFGGWVFQIVPTVVTGFLGVDPITIAVTATMGFVASAGLDLGYATPLRAVGFLFGAALLVWVAKNAWEAAGD